MKISYSVVERNILRIKVIDGDREHSWTIRQSHAAAKWAETFRDIARTLDPEMMSGGVLGTWINPNVPLVTEPPQMSAAELSAFMAQPAPVKVHTEQESLAALKRSAARVSANAKWFESDGDDFANLPEQSSKGDTAGLPSLNATRDEVMQYREK